MEYKSLAEQLVKKCLEKGADGAEVLVQMRRNLNIEVRNGEIETMEEASSHGVGFRVFAQWKMAFSSCNDFSSEALDNAISQAMAFAKPLTSDINNVLPEDQETAEVEGLYDPVLSQVSMDKKIEMAKTVETLAMKDSRITKSAGAMYREGEGETFIANSNGLSKSKKTSSVALIVSVVAEKGDQKSSGFEYCSRRQFADLKSPEEIADKAAKDAYEMLDPRMVKTQKAPVIFDPDVSREILEGILAAINGERVLQGASFLRESVGKKISSELITLIDDGTRPKGMRSTPFDGEGVPTQKRIIVDKGVLKGFLYNTIVAKRAGVKSTGNASRESYRNLPGIEPHNFYMENGESPPERIIQSTKTGLLVKGVTGYGINPVNGNFSGGASGFWIENGRIAFPVKGLTIAGTADSILHGIDMVGNDLDLNLSPAMPTLRVQRMQIGGK